jgi:ActR/RegA family two-component response regulator
LANAIIIITAYGTIGSAVEAMKLGAGEFDATHVYVHKAIAIDPTGY